MIRNRTGQKGSGDKPLPCSESRVEDCLPELRRARFAGSVHEFNLDISVVAICEKGFRTAFHELGQIAVAFLYLARYGEIVYAA